MAKNTLVPVGEDGENARVVAFIHQKGETGKRTSCLNIGDSNAASKPAGPPPKGKLTGQVKLGSDLKKTYQELEKERDALLNDLQVLKKEKDALETGQVGFRNVLDMSADGVIITDKNGIIKFFNPPAESIFSRKANGLLGEVSGIPIVIDEYLEVEIRRKTKEVGVGELQVVETEWEGKPANLAMIRDITRRQQAEAAVLRSGKDLRQAQKMEAIGRLSGGVAHDFNNILTAITGYSDLLLTQTDISDTIRADVKEIKKAAARSVTLISQLMAFSRQQALQPKILDLNELVYAMEKMLRRIIGEDIEIVICLNEWLGNVKADPGQIEQVVMNLVVNARDAMPVGGRLSLRSENVSLDAAAAHAIPGAAPGEFVCLSVEDTGIGMDKETIERIFEPFFTTKGLKGGTGLGLSTAYGIVKQHGGWMNVYSEPGRGSVFKTYLPIFSVRAEEETPDPVSLKELRGNGEKILLVEDEEAVRKFASRALSESGYIIFEAASGREALDIFNRESGRFDLVFSDSILPDQLGLEIIKQFLHQNQELRVLMTSGYPDDKSRRFLINQSGFPYLQKPYPLHKLLQAVKEAIASV